MSLNWNFRRYNALLFRFKIWDFSELMFTLIRLLVRDPTIFLFVFIVAKQLKIRAKRKPKLSTLCSDGFFYTYVSMLYCFYASYVFSLKVRGYTQNKNLNLCSEPLRTILWYFDIIFLVAWNSDTVIMMPLQCSIVVGKKVHYLPLIK